MCVYQKEKITKSETNIRPKSTNCGNLINKIGSDTECILVLKPPNWWCSDFGSYPPNAGNTSECFQEFLIQKQGHLISSQKSLPHSVPKWPWLKRCQCHVLCHASLLNYTQIRFRSMKLFLHLSQSNRGSDVVQSHQPQAELLHIRPVCLEIRGFPPKWHFRIKWENDE